MNTEDSPRPLKPGEAEPLTKEQMIRSLTHAANVAMLTSRFADADRLLASAAKLQGYLEPTPRRARKSKPTGRVDEVYEAAMSAIAERGSKP